MTPVAMDLHLESIRERCETARSGEGDLVVVRFGVRGIQSIILRSRRQPAIRGASRSVISFSDECAKLPGCIFAAAGHGLLIVESSRCESAADAIRSAFDKHVGVGELDLVTTPYMRGHEERTLRWSQMVAAARSNAGMRRPVPVAASSSQACPSCFSGVPSVSVYWPDDNAKRMICEACSRFFKSDPNRGGEHSADLSELAHSGRLATICADGIGIGSIFDAADSLDATAATSSALGAIFVGALEEVEATIPSERILVPITGGDDIRIFVDGVYLRETIDCLRDQVHNRAQEAGDLLKDDHRELAKKVERLGVGVGVVISAPTFPATRLAQLGETLMERAKRHARRYRERSALDLAFLINGEEMNVDPGISASALTLSSPQDLVTAGLRDDHPRWERFLRRASALRHVPTTQRALVLTARDQERHTFANFFRYQVARSQDWQAYLRELGTDWTDADAAVGHAPVRRDHEMARLLEKW